MKRIAALAPLALVVLVSTVPTLAQMSGTYTIDNTLPTGGTNYASFEAAVADLNSLGISSSVLFNVTAGQTFPDSIVITASGTIANTITFQKNGGGANPIIQRYGTTGTTDAIVTLSGADYVTFDGIDVSPGGGSADVEYGYCLVGASVTNGAQYDTVRNCTITLNKANINSRGVSVTSTASAASGANSNNKFYNNTVQNAYVGYWLYGSSSPIITNDDANEVGTIGGGASIITDIGGGSSAVYGIYVAYQTNLKVFKTAISGLTGSVIVAQYYESLGPANSAEIYQNNFGGAVAGGAGFAVGINISSGGTHRVYENEIHGFTSGNFSYGIYLAGGGVHHLYRNKVYDIGASMGAVGVYLNSALEHNVYNNMVYDVWGGSGSFASFGLYIISGTTVNIFYNSVLLNYTHVSATGTAAVYASASPGSIDMRNNIFVNNDDVTAGGQAVAFRTAGFANIAAASDNNLYYAGTPGPNNLIAKTTSSSYETLASYKAAVAPMDEYAVSENPPFVSTTDLHLNPIGPTGCDGGGTPVIAPFAVPTDIDGESRDASIPDIGADEWISTTTVGVPVALSWNIISLPVTAPTPDDSVQHVFTNSVNTYGFAFQNGYVEHSTLANGLGYWIKSSAAYTQNITGSPRNTLTVPVALNWNMIGSISTSIDTSAAYVTPSVAGLRGSNFFKYENGYVVATTIQPGLGYWVRANSAGSFFMHATGPAAKQATGEPTAGGSIGELNTLTIRDARGGSQTLYFGADAGGEIPVNMFAMPPSPPVGAFDARFESADGGTMVQTHAVKVTEAVEFPVTIQSVAYPLTISWNVTKGTASYELTDGQGGRVFHAKDMQGEGTMKIANSNVSKFSVKLVGDGQLPTEFALSQNYPNPFNPSTQVKFSVAVAGRATVEMFNILGQKVRALFNENAEPGRYYNLQVDGTNLASGVYFYTLRSTGRLDTRKMMLLK